MARRMTIRAPQSRDARLKTLISEEDRKLD